MAKVLFSGSISEIKGRLKGWSYQRSLYGQQINTTNWGVTRRNTLTGSTRSAFRSVVSLWRTLTAEEQSSWQLSATDSGGAYQAFVSYNIPYWVKHHAIQKTNPAEVTSINWKFTSVSGTFNSSNLLTSVTFKFSSNVNLEGLQPNLNVLVDSYTNFYGVPNKNNANSVVPDDVSFSGTTCSIVFTTPAKLNLNSLRISASVGLWVTPLDSSTNTPIGSEVEAAVLLPANLSFGYSSVSVSVRAADNHVKIDILAFLTNFLVSVPPFVDIRIQIATSPTEPPDPSSAPSWVQGVTSSSFNNFTVHTPFLNLQGSVGNPAYIWMSLKNNAGQEIVTQYIPVTVTQVQA